MDYAIFENSDKGCVVELDAGWSDVGSWSSLGEVRTTDESGNVAHGDIVLEKTANSIIWSDDNIGILWPDVGMSPTLSKRDSEANSLERAELPSFYP